MPKPERIRWAKLRSLLTVVAALLILSVLVYLLLGGNPLRRNVMIRSYVIDSGGMPPGAPVRLNGIRIGKVESVGLAEPPRGDRIVEVRMRVEAPAAARIPEDSIVEIGSDSLLGDKLIDITVGRSARAVSPEGELPYKPPAEIDRAQVIASFERTLRLIDRLLDDIEAGRGSLARFVRDDAIYVRTTARLKQVEASLRSAAASGLAGRFLRDDEMYRSWQALITRYDARLADLETGRGAAGEFLRSSRQHDDLVKRIASMRADVARLRNHPMVLSDAQYQRWNRAVEKLIASIDALTTGDSGLARLLQTAHTYESLAGASRNLSEGLRDFRQNPRKFLRIDLDLF
jgi:phospholipid/cholesterol/gamma-HCH transport system substrate-binding protein